MNICQYIRLTCTVLQIHKDGCKYKSVDTVMLTVSSVPSIDEPLICCVWLCAYEQLVSKFWVQKIESACRVRMCLVLRCAKAQHRLPVPQYSWVMKARNNSAVHASEIGSIVGETDCVRLYDYIGVALNLLSVSGSLLDTDVIVCVCVCEQLNCGVRVVCYYLVTDKRAMGGKMCDGFCSTRVICRQVEHKALCMYIYIQGVSFILLAARQMSRGMPAGAGAIKLPCSETQ